MQQMIAAHASSLSGSEKIQLYSNLVDATMWVSSNL
jgi:hypothetical protein